MNTRQAHPEIRQGEIFYTNIEADKFADIPLKTKRKGKNALSVTGEKLPEDLNLVPVFVQERENRWKNF